MVRQQQQLLMITVLLSCSQLLKGRHMMVRVGGGWDTLEHFLARHDPCQVRTLNRESTPPSPHGNKHSNFLPIRAKYRSPPPEFVSAR